MKKILLPLMALVIATLNMQAQPPADSTPTYPQGATYTHSSGTATITSDYSSSTQYYNVIQCTGGTLTMNGCTITKTGDGSGCTVTVPSGILMYVMADSQWSTSGAIGNLILDNGTYSGIVKYDSGYTANVTVNSGATWNLTANTTISTLVNNGTINCNGYTLTYSSKSGSGTINESSNISAVQTEDADAPAYTLDGRRVKAPYKGVIVKDGRKYLSK